MFNPFAPFLQFASLLAQKYYRRICHTAPHSCMEISPCPRPDSYSSRVAFSLCFGCLLAVKACWQVGAGKQGPCIAWATVYAVLSHLALKPCDIPHLIVATWNWRLCAFQLPATGTRRIPAPLRNRVDPQNAPLYGPDWPGCPTYPDNDRQATPGFSAVVETIHAPSVHWLAVIQQLPHMILYTYPLTLARGFKAIRLDGSIIATASEFRFFRDSGAYGREFTSPSSNFSWFCGSRLSRKLLVLRLLLRFGKRRRRSRGRGKRRKVK
jgi:hypothetical protein